MKADIADIGLRGPEDGTVDKDTCNVPSVAVKETLRARKRRADAAASKRYRAKVKMEGEKDPIAHAEFLRNRNARKRELRNEKKHDDPIAHAESKQKYRDLARELRAERKKDPVAFAQFNQRDKERRMEKLARERLQVENDG